MNDIIKFHIDHGYYVDVQSLPKIEGCCVTFPKNKFKDYGKTTITYLIDSNPMKIELYELQEDKEMDVRKVQATRSSARILVLEDILLRTLARKLAQCLIIVDKTAGKNVFDAISFGMDEESLILEKDLLGRFRELILGKVNTDIDDSELAEGYRLILNCFENGGL